MKGNKVDKYIVMRMPCLMEDEGRSFYIGSANTKEEAEKIIECETADGYFTKNNYKIYEEN